MRRDRAGDVVPPILIRRRLQTERRHHANTGQAVFAVVLQPVTVEVVEDLADHVGAIERRIGHKAHGGGCVTGHCVEGHAGRAIHDLRVVHKFALGHAGAYGEQQFHRVHLSVRNQTVPAEHSARDRRLGRHAIEKPRALDVGESQRDAVHDAHVRERHAGNVLHGDHVRNQLPAGHVDQRRRLGD